MNKYMIFLFVAMWPWVDSFAQDEVSSVEVTETARDPVQEGTGVPIFNTEYLAVNIYGGNYIANKDSELEDLKTEYAFAISGSMDFNRYPFLGLDIEMLSVSQNFDTPLSPPLLGTIDNNTSIDITALMVGARAFYPLEGRWNTYAVAGLGYFYTRMLVHGSTIGLPGELEDTDRSIQFYYGCGIRYMFGNWGVSLGYRHIALDGSFGSFQVGNVDLGGELYLAGLTYLWHY